MYKIKQAKISHNKRMMSGLIREIDYSPESPYQIIIGPNGVGKSAMMDELSPIPAAKNRFLKEGEVNIVYEMDEGEIEIKSTMGSSARHEFWKDGENLNTGGTATVQKDLVMQHFNVSDLAYEIMNKKFSFVRASAGKRQEIMTQLANNDMTYAYKLFINAKKKLSHAIGAKKMLEESLSEKKVLLIDDDELYILEQRLNQYQNDVISFLKMINEENTLGNTNLPIHWENIKAEVNALPKLFPTININATDRSEHVSLIESIELSIQSLKTQENLLQNEYDELDDLIKRASDASSENIDRLKDELRYQSNLLSQRKEQPFFNRGAFNDVPAYNIVAQEIDAVWSEWKELYGSITSDQEGKLSREFYLEQQKKLESYRNHLNTLKVKFGRVEEQLSHLDEGKKVNCPQCGLHFTPGVSLDARPRLLKEQEELGNSIRKGQEAIDTLIEEIAVIDQWVNDYRSILNLERVCTHADFFFSTIRENVNVKSQPLQAIVYGTQLYNDLIELVEQERIKEKITEVKGVLKTLEENNIQGIQGIIERHGKVKERVIQVTQEIIEKVALKESLTNKLNEADKYVNQSAITVERYQNLIGNTQRQIEYHFNEVRNIIVQDLQGHIGSLTKQINDVKTLKVLIADLEVQLEKQESLIAGYSELVDSLSPKHGIVAEQMSGFNFSFIAAMNEVIEGIWTYPLEIHPGETQDGIIDYQFPFRIHNRDELIKDISEGSDGQLAIFDFAFLITAMVYLGQINVPLLLDEVDRPLEPAHKERLMYFLTRGVESGRFSQVFLISHHASSHGALPFSDIVDFSFKNPQEGSNVVATLH